MMRKEDLERVFNQIRIIVPGVSDSGIKAKMFEVLKEFFEDSLSWKEDITFQAQANVQTYPIVPQKGGQLWSLGGVWDQNHFPVAAFIDDSYENLQVVYPITTLPSNLWTMRIYKTVALPTTRDDIPIAPAWMASKWSAALVDGLVGNLTLEQGKSYTDLNKSAYHLKRFRKYIQDAKVSAMHAHTRGAQAWSFPTQWRTNSQRGGLVTAWPGVGYGE